MSFRYPPFKNKYTTIPFEAIIDFDQDSYPYFNYGYHVGGWNIMKKTPSVTMAGLDKVIKIKFNENNHILIGTRKPKDFLAALKLHKEKNDEV